MSHLSEHKELKRTFKNEYYWYHKYLFGSKHHRRYNSRKVILLRLDLIGDCAMFSSTAKAIREFYADRDVTVVCLSISKPIFERMGVFNKIIDVDFRPENIDYTKLTKLIKKIRESSYDILLQPQVSKYPLADILAASTKCNQRIAIEPLSPNGNSSPCWLEHTNPLYDELVPYPRGNVSEFDYYGAFVRGLGLASYKTARPFLPHNKQQYIECDYYVIYPGGSYTQKIWPLDRFATIANHVYQKTGLVGVILGSAGEKWISEKIREHLTIPTALAIIDLTGKTSIFDVIDIIGDAKFVVSNDTSGVHIAAATNTPSIAVVGGWHFNRFLPYHIEKTKTEDHLPLVAYTPMACFYCNLNRDLIKKNCPSCFHNLELGRSCDCIEAVSVEQVQILVDSVIRAEGL